MQVARWLFTLQTACTPHCSGMHGSRHFCPMHARWSGHSGSLVHSGLGARNKMQLWTITQASGRLTFSNWRADLVCISFISRRADASRAMVFDLANRIDPALVVIHAGIFAFLANACKSSGAVFVNCTLGLALDKGISLKSRRTRALADTAGWSCNRVLAARVWFAGIESVRLRRRRAHALHKSVANVARQAGADWRVISDVTLSVATTHTRTGVVTLVVAARLRQRTVAVDDTLRFALNVRIP